VIFFASVEQDEDGFYVAEAVALPGCVTQGRTEQEALTRLQEAIAGWLEAEAAKRLPAKPKESLREVSV